MFEGLGWDRGAERALPVLGWDLGAARTQGLVVSVGVGGEHLGMLGGLG